MPDTQDIVQKLWSLCQVLRDDGITYLQYVTELTYLLFLKMTKETGTEEFLTGSDAGPQLQRFIDEARRSRLGLHQDVMRTKKLAKFRELFTGNEISPFPSINEYGKGEILLARTMAYGDEVFIFGNTNGFPKDAKKQIEDMVLDKLFDFDEGTASAAQYEAFMKLAGPTGCPA
jgi:HsdM N-terminal domain